MPQVRYVRKYDGVFVGAAGKRPSREQPLYEGIVSLLLPTFGRTQRGIPEQRFRSQSAATNYDLFRHNYKNSRGILLSYCGPRVARTGRSSRIRPGRNPRLDPNRHFGAGSATNVPIPFDVRHAQIFYRDSDNLGLDFGVIILDSYYVRLLAMTGVVAISEKNWIDQGKIDFDGYALLGFPQELVSERASINGEINLCPLMFPVDRLAAAPPERRATYYPQFVGQLRPHLNLKSVRGMSGGPIFGFRNSDSQYWIIALQSSWDPQKRIIYGCSLPVIGAWLTNNAMPPASAA